MAPSEAAEDVLAVQRGDRDAFGSLLARYQNRLFRYLLRWVRETATAEDLFQQTWMRVLKHINRFDPKRNFEAWLFALARNIAIDHLRRSRHVSLEEPIGEDLALADALPSSASGPLEQMMISERADLVLRALEAQPAVYREVLSLRFEEEMKLEEIAEVLDLPLGTVKSRLGRALERMRAALQRVPLEGLTP